MSDYLFTSQQGKSTELTSSIKQIYQAYEIECQEFEGEWGSLSVSPSPYNGLQPLETESHIFIVLGGPVLYFRDNSFLTGDNPTEGTEALLERYLANELDLENDLSGPFQFVIVDKAANKVTCITDLMLFIPAYVSKQDTAVTFGSHVDAVARAVGANRESLDKTSIADFILHGVVTFPYTVYSNIKQMHPATYYEYKTIDDGVSESVSESYWLPRAKPLENSLIEEALKLRKGLLKYITTLTQSMVEVAQFISGGEDSRTLSGLIPSRLKRDAYIFLDDMNKEGKIARRVADACGANFFFGKRSRLHYIDILHDATSLVGSGNQYMHCHTLKFDKAFELRRYPAVFGGYISDTLLKGLKVKKVPLRQKLSFLKEKELITKRKSYDIKTSAFSREVLRTVNERRQRHYDYLFKIRPQSANEWIDIWPATMSTEIPNFFCNRRLFASYEIFMSHEVIKASVSSPTEWKLNRKIFHCAFKPFLKETKWIRHGDGWLPYFSHTTNIPLNFYRVIVMLLNKVGLIPKKGKNDGPWSSWDDIQSSSRWIDLVNDSNSFLGESKILKNGSAVRAHESISRNMVNIVQIIKKVE